MCSNALMMEQIIKSYIDDPIASTKVLGSGHINSSVLVKGRELYVLQRLNSRLYSGHLDELEHNYLSYRAACLRLEGSLGEWYCPDWLKDRDGRFFHKDSEGNAWRLYRYLASEPSDMYNNTYSIGRGLGKLHKVLKECTDIKTIETTAHLHDLSYHFEKYRMQVDTMMERIAEFDRLIPEMMDRMSKITVPVGRVIHGDAKCDNMLFKGGEVVGFLDLDTLMHGSLFDDISDCMRPCVINERGECDPGRADEFYRGYEEGLGSRLSKDETALADANLSRNRFMLGLRYYTDYLSGEGYFSGTPAGKLEKARRLFA